jgi:hypothetical protein
MKASVFAALLCSASLPISAATFLVTNNSENGPGSLEAAILDANAAAGDSHRIEFGPDVGLIDLIAPLPIITKRTLEIDASNRSGIQVAPINPTAGFRLIRVANTVNNLTLRGFDLRSGFASGSGEGGGCVDGADANANAELTLDRMQFVGCITSLVGPSRGGAVYWNGLRVSSLQSRFESNAALGVGNSVTQAAGGAIFAREVNLRNSQFISNQTTGQISQGGAVFASRSSTILDTQWLNNSAIANNGTSVGGALALDCAGGCLFELRRGFFGGNSAMQAGALYARSSNQFASAVGMENIAFANNSASGTTASAAGALVLEGQPFGQIVLDAFHLSFQGNQGPTAHLVQQGNAALRLLNNSVFGRSATPGCSAFAANLTALGNITTDSSCQVVGGAQLISTLMDGPVAIREPMSSIGFAPNSPLLDTANAAQCRATDALGVSRPRDGNGDGVAVCDVGAFELVDALFRDGFE